MGSNSTGLVRGSIGGQILDEINGGLNSIGDIVNFEELLFNKGGNIVVDGLVGKRDRFYSIGIGGLKCSESGNEIVDLILQGVGSALEIRIAQGSGSGCLGLNFVQISTQVGINITHIFDSDEFFRGALVAPEDVVGQGFIGALDSLLGVVGLGLEGQGGPEEARVGDPHQHGQNQTGLARFGFHNVQEGEEKEDH